MSLAHAILGFLDQRPMTGYDLKTRQFDQSVNHFWNADQSQIYRTLDRLTDAGLVEATIEVQDGRPNRKVYAITAAGRDELRAWLTTVQPLPIYREAFLIQIFFAAQLSNETIVGLLQQQIDMHRERLAHYEAIHIPDPGSDPQKMRLRRLQNATLDYGKRGEQMYIDWLEATMEMVRGLPEATHL